MSYKSHLALPYTTVLPPQPDCKLLMRPEILLFSFTPGSLAEVWAQNMSAIVADNFRLPGLWS